MTRDSEQNSGTTDPAIPERGRLLGIDYGTVRVGVAVCDVQQRLASPYESYTRRSRQADADFFRNCVREFEAVGLVIGLPLHMSGEESDKSREARQYGRWLSRVTELPVAWQDERLSTAQADVLLHSVDLSSRRRRQHRDKLAAHIILQSWLDRRRSG